MSGKSKLEFAWARYDEDEPESQSFLDFLVNDQSLFKTFKSRGFDVISCLGWGVTSVQVEAIKRLLLKEPADLPDDRRSLYICHIDGDIGCGAVTLKIEMLEATIIWRDFGFEYNYVLDDEDPVHLEGLKDIGPFIFDRNDYVTAFEQVYAQLESNPRR